VVVLWCMPMTDAHSSEVNWAPRSDVRWAGTPKRATHWLMRVSLQVSVSIMVRGTASSILLDLLMMVNRYRNPSLEIGSGPTMSTWMWENRC